MPIAELPPRVLSDISGLNSSPTLDAPPLFRKLGDFHAAGRGGSFGQQPDEQGGLDAGKREKLHKAAEPPHVAADKKTKVAVNGGTSRQEQMDRTDAAVKKQREGTPKP